MELWTSEDLYGIPAHMHHTVLGYINDGIPPGSFFTAVICNDLHRTYERADLLNRASIGNYAGLLTRMPMAAWGSKEALQSWCNKGGLNGLIAASA